MIYIIIIPILVLLVIHSHNLAKAGNDKILEELTEQLGLEEWQARILREYLQEETR